MTRTLIVSCSLKGTANEVLLDAISDFSDCKVVHFREIDANYQVDKHIDAVVLSGSAARIVDPSHRAMFEGTINLIRKWSRPLLGICFGHQLLCWAYGAAVGCLNQAVLDRFEKINVITGDELFAGFTQPVLAENHYDYVLKESLDKAGFILLADSASCEVEAVEHRIKPLYGVQFHPERIKVKEESHADGLRIIENFYRNVVKKEFSMLCERCESFLKEGESYDFHGKIFCEDCYMYETNPHKACDPMAVSTALSIRKQLGQSVVAGLTEFQQRICCIIEQKQKITKDELLKIVDIKPEELEVQFAILLHCELIRGFKEGDKVYLTKW